MSSNLPPKFPSTAVFIPAFWTTATSGTLTQDQADARYLKFPTGQGTESIPNLIVSGSSTLGAVSLTSLSAPTSSIITSSVDDIDVGLRTKGSSFQSTAGVLNLQTDNYPITKSTLISMNAGKATVTVTGTGNDFTFVNPPVLTNAPANYDNSTKVPTTGWINTTNGWKYTLTNTMTASTTTFFNTCFSAGNFNGYDVFFTFNFTAPTSGYFSCNITLQGIVTPAYNVWSQTTSTGGSQTTSFSSTNAYIPIIGSMDATSNVSLRSQQPKISFWGCITNPLVGVPQVQFSAENYAYANPGITGTGKYWGYVQGASGSLSGLVLTFGAAMTGSVTITATSRG